MLTLDLKETLKKLESEIELHKEAESIVKRIMETVQPFACCILTKEGNTLAIEGLPLETSPILSVMAGISERLVEILGHQHMLRLVVETDRHNILVTTGDKAIIIIETLAERKLDEAIRALEMTLKEV